VLRSGDLADVARVGCAVIANDVASRAAAVQAGQIHKDARDN
jgi:hypothetical protein